MLEFIGGAAVGALLFGGGGGSRGGGGDGGRTARALDNNTAALDRNTDALDRLRWQTMVVAQPVQMVLCPTCYAALDGGRRVALVEGEHGYVLAHELEFFAFARLPCRCAVKFNLSQMARAYCSSPTRKEACAMADALQQFWAQTDHVVHVARHDIVQVVVDSGGRVVASVPPVPVSFYQKPVAIWDGHANQIA